MAAIPYKTAIAFKEGRRSSNGAFRSEGYDVWSYGLKLADRWTDDEGVIHCKWVIDSHYRRSQTTDRHMSALRFVIGESELLIYPRWQRGASRGHT